MPAKRRTPTRIAHDRAEVAARYIRGQKQSQIAASLGLSQQQISHDLAAIQQEWRQSAIRDFDDHKARELAKLDELERQCWAAWERSCQPTESTFTTKAEDEIEVRAGHAGSKRLPAKRTRMQASKRTEQQVGNSAYLYAIQRIVETRCKILGLYAAQDINVTGSISFGDLYSLATQDTDRPEIRVLPPIDGEAG